MVTGDERQQFRILYRDFLSRIVDLEILSSRGEIQKLLVQFAAMLAAFSFCYVVVRVTGMAHASVSFEVLSRAVSTDQEFLIATTMAIAGLFTILAWNTVLPDRRDCLILGLLPLRVRTLFLAKAAAIGTGLGISIAAVNSFSGLTVPFIAPAHGALRSFFAHWAACTAAGVFVCATLIALQGATAQMLSYRRFLRISSWLQLGAFFTILGVYFLKPAFPNAEASRWLPSFWFAGLLQQLQGVPDPLAGRALGSLAAALGAAAATFALAYRRSMRKIVEEPDIAPADRSRPAARVGTALAAWLLRRPIDRAIVLFTARTIARSRQHRLLLAAYGGIGLAISLAYMRSLIYGSAGFDPLFHRIRWNDVNGPFLTGSLVMLFFAIIGLRAVFALPVALPANWIFRTTAVHSPAAYFRAVRKALYALAVMPVWILMAVFYFAIWPPVSVLQHLTLMGVLAIIVVERSLARFRKLPFTCSYLPGKANLQVRLGCWGAAFLFIADLGVQLEYWSMQRPVRFAVLLAILGFVAWRSGRRRTELAGMPHNRIQFEDVAPREIESLDLRRDAAWSGTDAYIDAVTETETASLQIPIRTVMEQILRDLRHGARILTRSPGFSIAVVLLVALGIGGNTTIFSVINGILTKPAPGITADNLVSFGINIDGIPEEPYNSLPNYFDFASETRTLRSLAAFTGDRYTLTTPDGTWELRGQLVTRNYFETLGVRLARGREFTAEEARGEGAVLPAIIAWHIWRNQFQSDENILGRPILLSGQPAVIVGVGPPRFVGTILAPSLEVCIPLSLRSTRPGMRFGERSERSVGMIGRLAPGVSLSQAQAEFDGLAGRLRAFYPEANKGRTVVLAHYTATGFGPLSRAQARLFMAILSVVALMALLIVCANVANLMLARSARRQREMAVRQSLGASRGRVLRILLAEGLVLSLAASCAAMLITWWTTGLVGKLSPELASGAHMDFDFAPDWRVILYAMLLAAGATLAFTLAPALRAWRQALLPWLKSGEHSVIQGRSTLANVLVVAQLALCVVLLTSAGMAQRALSLIDGGSLHFRKDHLLLATVNTSGAVTSEAQGEALLERIRMRVRSVPGVVSASYAWSAPPNAYVAVPVKAAGASETYVTDMNFVGPAYLETLGVPIVAGRGIAESDLSRGRGMVVVNQKLARTLWPNRQAVGQTLLLTAAAEPAEVAGVVPDGAFSGIGPGGAIAGIGNDDRPNFVFFAGVAGRGARGEMTLHIRYAGDLKAITQAVRAAVRETDSRVPVPAVRTMETAWNTFTAPIRIVAGLLGAFSLCALLLASVGLYAVIAFYTARRTREFGIRMALGASPTQTISAVMQDGLKLTAAGVALGFALSMAAGRLASSLLFGTKASSAPTYFAVAGVLAAISLLACYLPARRAARIDPTDALRHE